ncbi:hypothetical protein [Actinoplanes sp. NPDC051851]|uniref:hypothetical protein n=1 Tax=Actinoplanes sp. NPDC051851 TaxID=3154753 RepID=UPI003429BE89
MASFSWSVAGPLVALVSLAFGVYQYVQGRSKELTLLTLYDGALMRRLRHVPWTELEVAWQGSAIHEPRIIVVRLENTGRVELKRDDIEAPILLEVSPARLLATEVTFHAAGSLGGRRLAPVNVATSSAELERLMLNPGDSVTIALLVDGESGKLDFALSAAGFRVILAVTGTVLRQSASLAGR